MNGFFRKPLSELALSDIQELIAEGYPEGSRLEYKGSLPTPDGKPDSWHAGGKLGDYARDKIMREVVAFANAFGGFVLLGVAEDPDDPHRPGSLAPVPRCEELAHRLRQMARDLIDPTIPLLDCVGLPASGDGAGVLDKPRQQVHRSVGLW